MKRSGPVSETPEMLLERFKATGHPEAVGALFDTLAPGLFRVALAICRDADQAEDVLQETFLAALSGAKEFETGRPVRPWLVGILRNMAKRAGRDRSRRPDPDRLASTGTGEAAPQPSPEERERLRKAIDALEEPYRSVALLHYVHGLPPGEIAHLREEPPGTVRSTLHRARRLLHGVLVGIPALALLASPVRGLAAVREAVVRHAALQAAPATLLTLGGIVMTKKLLVGGAAALALLLLGTWYATSLRGTDDGEGTQGTEVEQPGEEGEPALTVHTPEKDARAASPRAPGPDRVVGDVVDESGRPIAGARVVAVSEAVRAAVAPDAAASSARSGPDGGFELRLTEEAPAFVLYAEAPGYAPLALRGTRGGMRKRIVLRPGARLTGRVLDAEDAPVPGAAVAVLAIVDTLQVVRRATADAEGRYEVVDLVPPGLPRVHAMAVTAWIRVEAEDFAPLTTPLRMTTAQALERDLHLVRGGIVHGRVVDAESDAPLSGAEVVLTSTEGMMGMGWGRDRTTWSPFGLRVLGVTHSDEHGGYRFEHVPASGKSRGASNNSDGRGGSALGRVGALLEGYASATETVSLLEDGAEQGFEIRLWPAAGLRGRVVDTQGRALEGVRVSCKSSDRDSWGLRVPGVYEDVPSNYDSTDKRGRFELRAVPALRSVEAEAMLQLMGPRGPRNRERSRPVDVTLRAGHTQDLGDVVYDPEAPMRVLRVRVVDEGGAPVWDALLGYQTFRASVRTDRDGRAGIGMRAARPTDPETVEMFASAPGLALGRFHLRLADPEEQIVRLGPGQPIRGYVRDAGGAPIERAWVEATLASKPLDETYSPKSGLPVQPGGRPLPVYARASTDADGAFTLAHLPPGRYHLAARAQQQRAGGQQTVFARAAKVEAGVTDALLVVPKAPTDKPSLEVRVVDEAGDPVGPSLASLTAAPSARRIEAGRFRFDDVPPGLHTLRVYADGFVTRWREVVVSSEHQEPLEVVLSRGVRVAGRVAGTDSTLRLEGMRISFYRHGVSETRPEGAMGVVDSAGRFTLAGLHAGSYRVQLTPAAYTPGKFEAYVQEENRRVDIPEGASELSPELRVVPAGILQTWPEDARLPPRPGSGKQATRAQRDFARGCALEVRDPHGRLLLRVDAIRDEWGGTAGHLPLAPGTYTIELQLSDGGRVRRTADVRVGQATEAPLRASR